MRKRKPDYEEEARRNMVARRLRTIAIVAPRHISACLVKLVDLLDGRPYPTNAQAVTLTFVPGAGRLFRMEH